MYTYFFYYLILDLLIAGADKYIVDGGADLQGLVLAGVAGPHDERYFDGIIHYGRDIVREPDLLLQIDHGHAFLPLHYVKVQAEGNLGEGHDYGGEELQAEDRV